MGYFFIEFYKFSKLLKKKVFFKNMFLSQIHYSDMKTFFPDFGLFFEVCMTYFKLV